MSDKPSIVETPESTRYYSNIAQVSSSQHDFRLRFGQAEDDGTGKVVTTVYMSPGHAKALLRVLRGQIERFESKMGEIRTQPIVKASNDEKASNDDEAQSQE